MDFKRTTPFIFTILIVLGLSSISRNALAAKDSYFHIPLYQFADQATLSLDINSADRTQSLVVYSRTGDALSEPTDPSHIPVGVTSDDRKDPSLASFPSAFSFKFPFWRSRSLIRLGGSTQDTITQISEAGESRTIKKNQYAVVLTESDKRQQLEIFHQGGNHISIPLSKLSDTFQRFFSDPVTYARTYTLKISGAIHVLGQEGIVLALLDRAAADNLLHLESIFIAAQDGSIRTLQDRRFNRRATVSSLRFESWNGTIDAIFDYLHPRTRRLEPIRLSLLTCDHIAGNSPSAQ